MAGWEGSRSTVNRAESSAACPQGATTTIHDTSKRSATMPKRGEKKQGRSFQRVGDGAPDYFFAPMPMSRKRSSTSPEPKSSSS